MDRRRQQQQGIVHVHIGRLSVDQAALGALPAAQLGEQVRQLLAQQATPRPSAPLARQVAAGVQARIAPVLPK